MFEAKYSGWCDSCQERIDPGDQVGYAEDELVHAHCDPKPDPHAPARNERRCFRLLDLARRGLRVNALDCRITDLIGLGTWNDCDCGSNPHHRWNCPTTPIWAQTMRTLDINPWLDAQFISTYSRSYSVRLQYV